MARESHSSVVVAEGDGVQPRPEVNKSLRDLAGQLQQMIVAKGALKKGSFTLSAGDVSPYYFDGRLLTLDPEGAALIGEAFLTVVQESGAEAVGGPMLGADPMATAIALTSYLNGTPIPAFIVRKETKEYGTERTIEGPLPKGSRVALVDDTCTSGKSLIGAIKATEAAGCKVVKVVTLLDRHGGGSDEIRRLGYDYWTMLEAGPDGVIKLAT